jgi:hypothetical protein
MEVLAGSRGGVNLSITDVRGYQYDMAILGDVMRLLVPSGHS